MTEIRGDDDLFSLMDEMATSQGFSGESQSSLHNEKDQSSSSTKCSSRSNANTDRCRLLPEVEGYGDPSFLTSSNSSTNTEIWNPLVRVNISTSATSTQSSCPPTNPEVELCRRRSYEKFKRGFYNIFKSTAECAAAAESDATLSAMRRKERGGGTSKVKVDGDVEKARQEERMVLNQTWGELPSHAILERWHFAAKLEEDCLGRKSSDEAKVGSKIQVGMSNNSIPTTATIRDMIVINQRNGTYVDPILVSTNFYQPNQQPKAEKSKQNRRERRKGHATSSSANHTNQNLLREEIIFQWKRERRRKIGGAAGNASQASKELEVLKEELDKTFSSNKFSRRVGGISRSVRELSSDIEADFMKELGRRAAAQQHATANATHGSKKKKKRDKSIPKIIFDSYDPSAKTTGEVTVSYSGLSLKINEEHYAKLQILFDRFNLRSFSLSEHRDAFASSLFSLLARYDMLEGSGLQSALTGSVFDMLLERFGCNTECFASPFNSRYERYCSAFPDTDRVFGSLGSFFDFVPKDGGCFQANPPFIADFIDKMRARMDYLIDSMPSKALMFIIFIPAWVETPGWKALKESPHLTKHVLLSQKTDPHYYCEGTQHRRQGRYRKATFDTSVFFLQSKQAKEKWPVDGNIVEELREAFIRMPEHIDGGEDTKSETKVKKRAKEKQCRTLVTDFVEEKTDNGVEFVARTEKEQKKKKRKAEKSIAREKSGKKKKRKTLVQDSSLQMDIVSGILGGKSDVSSASKAQKNSGSKKAKDKHRKKK